jgi:hypothetical protein
MTLVDSISRPFRQALTVIGFLSTATGFITLPAHGEDATQQALKAITDTADRICGTVSPSGQSNSFKVTGDVKAELSGLVKKLADLGIIGSGEVSSTAYEGVLQQELSSTLKDVRDCKLKTLQILKERLLPAQSNPSATLPSTVTIIGGDNVVSFGQISGITAKTVTINVPFKPELRILDRHETDAPDGTHTVVIGTEVVSPISPGLLMLQLQAQGIKNVSVMPPPTGGVSTMNMRNVRKGPDFFSAEIPSPHGFYIVTVVTEHPSDVRLDASF